MSVRDEMANLLRSLPVAALPCDQARALMPIVERVAREAVECGWGIEDDMASAEDFDAIVRRVVGDASDRR